MPSYPVQNASAYYLPPLLESLGVGATTPCDNSSISCISCPYAELIISGFRLSTARALGETERLDITSAARTPLTLDSRQAPLTPLSDYPKGAWLYGDAATGVWLDGFAPLGDAVGRQVHSATIQLDVDSERCWWYDDDMCNYLFEAEATSGTNMYALWASVLYILQVLRVPHCTHVPSRPVSRCVSRTRLSSVSCATRCCFDLPSSHARPA
jgi:hypothetical protein